MSSAAAPRLDRSFVLSTSVFGRALGVVYLLAFASLHTQLEGLIGERGILPAAGLVDFANARALSFSELPSVFRWIGAGDAQLHLLCVLGELAAIACIVGVAQGPASLVCGFTYLSFCSVGRVFFGYQWDSLLVEVGVAAAVVLPWARRVHEPPTLARWLLYLVLFRLLFLSGVVKIASGDPTWSELRALDVHYFTQPLPNPVAWFAHRLPLAAHRVETFMVFLGELVAPFLMVLGPWGRRATFMATLGLMTAIALTGNYGFFNALTVVLALPLLDDEVWCRVGLAVKPAAPTSKAMTTARSMVAGALVALGALELVLGIGAGSALPDLARETMRTLAPYRVVNGYGLFAVMTTSRREIHLEGSYDGVEWQRYEFAYKPNRPVDRPPVALSHMPRLDWQMWFAALGEFEDSPWLVPFMRALLEGRSEVTGLLARDPFAGRQPPRYVRARIASYEFSSLDDLWKRGVWWSSGNETSFGPVLVGRTQSPLGQEIRPLP